MISSLSSVSNKRFSEENSQNTSNISESVAKNTVQKSVDLPQDEMNRGKRMMSVLMGTLSKFKTEESDKSEANLKRILLEQRLAQKLAQAKEQLSTPSTDLGPELEEMKSKYANTTFPADLEMIKTSSVEAYSQFEKTQTLPVLFFKRAN